MPSQKAAFYKRHKLVQNMKPLNDGGDKESEEQNTSVGS